MLSELKFIFSDICRGCSSSAYKGGTVYFKHLSILDRSVIDAEYQKSFQKNLELGLKTRDVLFQEAAEEGLWSKEKDDALAHSIKLYERLAAGRAKSKSLDAAQGIVEGLRGYEKEIQELQNQKDNLLSQSAEDYAIEESLWYQMYFSSFSDSELTQPYFNKEEFDYLKVSSPMDFYSFRNLFIESLNKIDSKSLRLLSIQHFFQDLFGIFKDSPSLFFNKPAYLLTEFQVLMIRLGKYFSGVIELCDGEILKSREDPDLLESYAIIKNNTSNEE